MPTPQQLSNGVAALATLAERDLAALWRLVETADQAKAALAEVLPALVDRYGAAAAALAADWYDDLREEAEISGRFTAIPAELGETGAVALAGWGVGPLFAADPDWDSARLLVSGGLQRRIANAARDTVIGSSVVDHGADGWQRFGVGPSCGFCRMLNGRGAVYTEATVNFGAHDHCNCTATVAWHDHPQPVKPFTESQRRRTAKTQEKQDVRLSAAAADRARARKWIAENL